MSQLSEEEKRKIAEFQEEFWQLSQQIPDRPAGIYEIEIAEVLIVGRFFLTPEEAIVRDTKGELWRVPEDRSGSDDGLVSRWDIESGMKLRLTIGPVTVVPITEMKVVEVVR